MDITPVCLTGVASLSLAEIANSGGRNHFKKSVRIIWLAPLQYCTSQSSIWIGGRVVYSIGLENRRTETFRGFESYPIRQIARLAQW